MANAIRLSDAAEACIIGMQLNPNDANEVRTCVARYAMPDECCGQLVWAMHRVINAVMSIFGYSDWQKAETIVRDEAIRQALGRNLFTENPVKAENREIKKRVLEHIENYSKGLLSNCLLAAENPEKDLQELQGLITEMSLPQVLNQIASVIIAMRNG